MSDTIERLTVEILESDGSDKAFLAEMMQRITCIAEALTKALEKEKSRTRLKDAEIRNLKGQIAKLNKMMFGASSDINPDKELKVPVEGVGAGCVPTDVQSTQEGAVSKSDEPSPVALPKPRNRSGRAKRKWPDNLEHREEQVCTTDNLCPCGCGGTFLSFADNKSLEVVPARYFVSVRRYAKYRCRAKDKVIGLPFAQRIFPKTTVSNGFLASAVSMRFSWQLPWYRQEGILRSSGIDLSRGTLMKWSNRLATEALLPIYNLMEKELKQNSERLFMDETTLPMLQPGHGKTKTSYLFALHRDDRSFGGVKPPIVLYSPSKTRARDNIHTLLAGVSGIVQTDAYVGYAQLGKAGTCVENIFPVKCWAHARRKFTDEHKFNKTEDARTIIQMIAELYEVEKGVKGKPPKVRKKYRQKYSTPIIERIQVFLTKAAGRHLPKSGMGKAISYVRNQWCDLVPFLNDGRIDLDTNPVERMFKPTIVLRKNALFIGSDEGALAWGIHASIIETCKLNGVNPEPYLKWVLDQIANKLPRSEYEKLLPWNAPTEFLVRR